MRLQIGAYDANNLMLEDWSPFAVGFTFSSGERGYELCSGLVKKSSYDAAYWRERRGAAFIRVTADGVRLFSGRLETVATVDGGLRVEALGGFRAYLDAPYTRLWSTTGYENWEPVTTDDESNYSSEAFEIDNNNRLYIAPVTSQTYGATASERGGLVFKGPHNATADLKAISFTFEMTAASGWTARLYSYAEDYASENAEWTLNGTGSAQTGAVVVTLSTARPYIVLALYRTSAGATFSADIGTVHIKLTNVRITSTVTNDISTTLGTNIVAGSRTVTPGSMTNIYVGQALMIGGTVTERVIVTAVTSTTFTAVFANGHSNTDTVTALYVSAEEIVKALVSFADGVNDGQVDSSTALIDDTDRDLLDAQWEDIFPADILSELAALHNFEVGVFGSSLNGRTLHFRDRGSEARNWYVDATVELERVLEAVQNSAYGVYSDDRGRLLRTDVATNADSVEEYGITRRAAVYAETNDEDRAEDFRDELIETYADPPPRAGIYFTRVWTLDGVLVPLSFVAAGDYVTARNIPGNPSFIIARADYVVDYNQLTVEPLVRPPSVADSLSKGLKGENLSRQNDRVARLTKKVRVL